MRSNAYIYKHTWTQPYMRIYNMLALEYVLKYYRDLLYTHTDIIHTYIHTNLNMGVYVYILRRQISICKSRLTFEMYQNIHIFMYILIMCHFYVYIDNLSLLCLYCIMCHFYVYIDNVSKCTYHTINWYYHDDYNCYYIVNIIIAIVSVSIHAYSKYYYKHTCI
jgi:hypothetical protein